MERFIAQAKGASLDDSERQSLLGSLNWLLDNSISRTARELAASLLGDREYGGKVAAGFVNECYSIRSDIVHSGRVKGSKRGVSSVTSEFERLVADLLKASIGAL